MRPVAAHRVPSFTGKSRIIVSLLRIGVRVGVPESSVVSLTVRASLADVVSLTPLPGNEPQNLHRDGGNIDHIIAYGFDATLYPLFPRASRMCFQRLFSSGTIAACFAVVGDNQDQLCHCTSRLQRTKRPNSFCSRVAPSTTHGHRTEQGTVKARLYPTYPGRRIWFEPVLQPCSGCYCCNRDRFGQARMRRYLWHALARRCCTTID